MIKTFKRALTWSVVVTTIAWSVGASLLVAPLAAGAVASITSGSLIKGSLPAVYYYGGDGKRYVFPNESTYKTWYSDFSGVQTISDADLAAVTIGGNVTYKPGVKMVKITTDPKVYAVDAHGTLRHVATEAVAVALYGASWAGLVNDVPDAFFVNYTVGTAVAAAADFAKDTVAAAATSINVDKNLGGAAAVTPPAATAVITVSDGGSPAGATIPYTATNVIFAKVKLAGTGTVTGLKVTRTGLATDVDLSGVKIYDGTVQVGTTQTFNSVHQAAFSGLSISVAGEKVLTIAGDVAATGTAVAGDIVTLGIESGADITLSAGTVGGTFPIRGGGMTISAVTIGGATLYRGADMPTSDNQPAADSVDYRFTQVRILAGSTEDITVKQIVAIQSGTATTGDLKDIKLKNDTTGLVLQTLPSLASNGRAVFDSLSIAIKKGESLNLSILATLAGGSSSGRTIGFELHDGVAYTVQIVGNTYGFGITPTRNDFCATTGVTGGACQAQTVATGTLRLNRAASSPSTGKIAQGGTNVPLVAVDFTASGEGVTISSQNWDLTTNGTTALGAATNPLCSEVTSVTLYNATGNAVAGPKDCASGAVTFTETMTVPVGTNTYTLKANIASATSAGDTISAVLDVSEFTAKGATSGKATTVSTTTDITGNTLTVQAAALTATTLATPITGNVVANVKGFGFTSFTLDASSGGEDAKVASVTFADATGANALPNDLVNFEIWGDSDTTDTNDAIARIDTTNSTVAATATANTLGIDSTVAFTFKVPLRISKSKSATYQLRADVISTATAAGTHTGAAADNTHTIDVSVVSATGWTTGSAITITDGTHITGAGQAQIVRATGLLKVELAADRAVSGAIVAGSSGISMVKYKLTSSYEDVDVTELPIYLANGLVAAGSLNNVSKVKLYVNGNPVGNLDGYEFDSAAKKTIVLSTGTLRAVKDVATYLEFKANFNAKEQTTSGTLARVGIGDSTSDASEWSGAGSYAVVANGKDSGSTIIASTITDTGAAGGSVNGGNSMAVYDGVLTIGLDSSSPNGTQGAGTNKEVLRFWLTATGDEITVYNLNFSSSGTADTSAGTASLESSDGSTVYASFASADWGDDADFSVLADDSDTAFNTALVIGAGQTKTLRMKLNTTGAATNTTFQMTIQGGTQSATIPGSGVAWQDSEVVGLNTATCPGTEGATANADATYDAGSECVVDSTTFTKTLPVNGNGLSY